MNRHFVPDKHKRIETNQRKKQPHKKPPSHVFIYPDWFNIFAYFTPRGPETIKTIGCNFEKNTDPEPFFKLLEHKLCVSLIRYKLSLFSMYEMEFTEPVQLVELNRALSEIYEALCNESS